VQQRIDVILADIRASMADLQARLEAQVGSDDEEKGRRNSKWTRKRTWWWRNNSCKNILIYKTIFSHFNY